MGHRSQFNGSGKGSWQAPSKKPKRSETLNPPFAAPGTKVPAGKRYMGNPEYGGFFKDPKQYPTTRKGEPIPKRPKPNPGGSVAPKSKKPNPGGSVAPKSRKKK